MRHERDAPLPVVQTGAARDELGNAPGVFAANAGVAAHELLAGGEVERIPVVRALTPLVHRVEAHDFPRGQFGIEPVVFVVGLGLRQFGEALLPGLSAGFEFLGEEARLVVLVRGHVFGQLGDAEERVNGLECAGRKTRLDIAVQFPNLPQLCGEEHEGEIGLAADVRVGVQPRVRRGAVGGAERFEAGARLGGLGGGQLRPADAVKAVEQVHHMDALGEFHGGDWHRARI